MATVNIGNNFSVSSLSAYDADEEQLILSSPSSSGFSDFSPATGIGLQATGQNFTYDEFGWGGGTISSATFTRGGVVLLSATGLSADYPGSVLAYDNGYDGQVTGFVSQLAYWLRGADVFSGSSGDESLEGFGGNDTFVGDAGNDNINGGSGSDTVEYSGNRADFVVAATSAGYTVTSAAFGTDRLVNTEFLKFIDGTVAIEQAVGPETPVTSTPTADYLQQTFGITITEARNRIIDHLGTPGDIYSVCSTNNVTSGMVADIVQDSFPDIVITGTLVNEWLIAQGTQALA